MLYEYIYIQIYWRLTTESEPERMRIVLLRSRVEHRVVLSVVVTWAKRQSTTSLTTQSYIYIESYTKCRCRNFARPLWKWVQESASIIGVRRVVPKYYDNARRVVIKYESYPISSSKLTGNIYHEFFSSNSMTLLSHHSSRLTTIQVLGVWVIPVGTSNQLRSRNTPMSNSRAALRHQVVESTECMFAYGFTTRNYWVPILLTAEYTAMKRK